jgi:hypothetical protein
MKKRTYNSFEEPIKKNRFVSGECVSIFELQDLMGKNYPVNHVTLKLIDCMKPERFASIPSDSLLEYETFKLV